MLIFHRLVIFYMVKCPTQSRVEPKLSYTYTHAYFMVISAKRNRDLCKILLWPMINMYVYHLIKRFACILLNRNICLENIHIVYHLLSYLLVFGVFFPCIHSDSYEQSSTKVIVQYTFISFSCSCPASHFNNVGMMCNYALLEICVCLF